MENASEWTLVLYIKTSPQKQKGTQKEQTIPMSSHDDDDDDEGSVLDIPPFLRNRKF